MNVLIPFDRRHLLARLHVRYCRIVILEVDGGVVKIFNRTIKDLHGRENTIVIPHHMHIHYKRRKIDCCPAPALAVSRQGYRSPVEAVFLQRRYCNILLKPVIYIGTVKAPRRYG